jgi:Flp pilus assembly protein TadG
MLIRELKHRGVALLEMAIVLPLLMLMLFGILGYGILLYDQSVITSASREGARKGVVSVISGSGIGSYPTCNSTISVTTAAAAQTTAQCAAMLALSSNLITFGSSATTTITAVSTSTTGGACANPPDPNCILKVSITYPFVGVYIIDALTLSASTSMFYE